MTTGLSVAASTFTTAKVMASVEVLSQPKNGSKQEVEWGDDGDQ
jgi:hypothetical protein